MKLLDVVHITIISQKPAIELHNQYGAHQQAKRLF
jgi:hypothetical protein